MHIDPTTHEHGASGKVYTYESDFDVGDEVINWQAAVSPSGAQPRTFAGTIPLTSPAISTIAEQAVRDAIVKSIDTFDDKHGGSLDSASSG